MKRILPFPRGRMKMTTYSDDDEMSDEMAEYVARAVEPSYWDGLDEYAAGKGMSPTEKAELLSRNRSCQASMQRARLSFKAIRDFTRVVEETGCWIREDRRRRDHAMSESAATKSEAVERGVAAIAKMVSDDYGCCSDRCCCSGIAAFECKTGLAAEDVARAVINAALDENPA